MKTKTLLRLVMAIALISNGCKNTSAQNFNEEKVKAMLKEFYTSYVTLNSKLPVDVKKYDSIINKYCTKNVSNQFERDERIEYDPYLKSQMVETRILKTMTFRKDSAKDNLYYVSYTYNKNHVTIKLLIVKEKDGYKIDLLYKD